jgi:hypothetical protein
MIKILNDHPQRGQEQGKYGIRQEKTGASQRSNNESNWFNNTV